MTPFPVYCSPEDAFRLSDCPDPWVFVQKLHRLLLEGMPPTARRARQDSERENVPTRTWIGCRPTLLGVVLSKEFLRYHESPTGHTTLEHREFRGYAKPTLMIGPTWSDNPEIVWLDLHFLTMDFLEAWEKLCSDELATEPALMAALPLTQRATEGRRAYQTEKTASAQRLLDEFFPGGDIPPASMNAELLRQIMSSNSYKAGEDQHRTRQRYDFAAGRKAHELAANFANCANSKLRNMRIFVHSKM